MILTEFVLWFTEYLPASLGASPGECQLSEEDDHIEVALLVNEDPEMRELSILMLEPKQSWSTLPLSKFTLGRMSVHYTGCAMLHTAPRLPLLGVVWTGGSFSDKFPELFPLSDGAVLVKRDLDTQGRSGRSVNVYLAWMHCFN